MKKNQEQTISTKRTVELSKVSGLSDKNKDSAKAVDQEVRVEQERTEAYIEPKTRDLLRKLLQEGDNEEITPYYTPASGFVYQIPSNISDKNEKGALSRSLLENLTRLDILQKSFFDAVSTCPNCQSTLLTLHNRCPKCQSHNVEKTSLTEHIPCGYIDQRDKYLQNRCPKCGQQLLEGQYRNMGRWYVCQECGEKFENPEYDVICRNCSKTFTIKEAQVLEIPKFKLNLARKKEIRQNVASLEDIRAILNGLGFNIEIPGLLIGQKSGMQHHFSLIAKKQINGKEVLIALDHAISESEVQSSPLILYVYKTSEVKVDIPMFVAIPNLSETAKKIAQGHEILLVEGSTEEPEVKAKIKNEIEARIAQISQKPIDESIIVQPESKPESQSFFSKFRGAKKKA